jgi:hypothetical protein
MHRVLHAIFAERLILNIRKAAAAPPPGLVTITLTNLQFTPPQPQGTESINMNALGESTNTDHAIGITLYVSASVEH